MTEKTATEARILAVEASAGDDEDRSLNTLATLSLNTLTTSCNGGCSANSPCVVLGQSSDNAIDCVNDVRCATLLSGKTALCMEPFGASDATWAFAPAKSDDTSGVAPFERVGLVQLGDQVTEVDFKIAAPTMTPLTNLDISSLNVQPTTTLTKISFSDLILTGIDGALPLNGAKQIIINNCRLKTIPTQFIAGNQVASLDLSNNGILMVPTDFQNQSFPTLAALDLSRNALTTFNIRPSNFPALTSLILSNNQLQTFPTVVFNLTTLQQLSLNGNPLNASTLTEEQFTFLANLPFFSINGTTETDVCPSEDVVAKLNSTFTFCVHGNNSENITSVIPTTEPPATDAPVIQTSQDSSSSKTWIWIVIAIVCVLLFGLLFLLYRRKQRREESPKLANSITPSIAVGMGDLADHPYMELNPPSSCSQTTS
uniref:Uncharacterized protein n=1 Tax=Globisporangium ultimum (strain ATCC 200006 / CBS 805.95 / DAOM BR144) TaxID=431595 RepID=K3WQB5_GLOUD